VTLGERARKARDFLWDNYDAILVLVVSCSVLVLELFGDPSRELVDSAILGVLGVTALVHLRDRSHRADLSHLLQLAGDAITDRPYEAVWQENEWDLRDPQTSFVTQTEQIRFTRNDVATNFHWAAGEGELLEDKAKWRPSEGKEWIPAPKIHEFSVRGGTKAFYSFDEEHCRGDMLEWCVERKYNGRFPTKHESVQLTAWVPSDHPRIMRIIWPTDAPPAHVQIRLITVRHGKEPARAITPRRREGRAFIEEKAPGMEIGDIVRVEWTW
jgi:hypothetical protein